MFSSPVTLDCPANVPSSTRISAMPPQSLVGIAFFDVPLLAVITSPTRSFATSAELSPVSLASQILPKSLVVFTLVTTPTTGVDPPTTRYLIDVALTIDDIVTEVGDPPNNFPLPSVAVITFPTVRLAVSSRPVRVACHLLSASSMTISDTVAVGPNIKSVGLVICCTVPFCPNTIASCATVFTWVIAPSRGAKPPVTR